MRWMSEQNFRRLLVKAYEEGIRLEPVPRTEFVKFATSASDAKKRYVVSDNGCNCAAAENGVDCKHYALFTMDQLPRLIETYGAPQWLDVPGDRDAHETKEAS